MATPRFEVTRKTSTSSKVTVRPINGPGSIKTVNYSSLSSEAKRKLR